MEPNSKKIEMQKRYNSESYVGIYDNRYKKGQFEKIDYLMRYLTSPNGLILDFGCGTGLLYDYMTQLEGGKAVRSVVQKKHYKMVGIDLSYTMIYEFHKKVHQNKNHSTGVNLVVCDGENLPFREGLFDDVYALTSLQNLPDIQEGFKQIRKVSASGCRYGLTFLKKSLEGEEIFKLMLPFFPGITEILPDSQNTPNYDSRFRHLEDLLFVGC